MDKPYEVFLSHSSIDAELANRVCHALESGGIKCWIAPRDIKPSDSFEEAIVSAIHTCPVFVLLGSDDANASEHVSREVAQAAKHHKKMFPFMLQDTQLTGTQDYYLSSAQRISAFRDFNDGLNIMIAAIQAFLHGPAPDSEKPGADVPDTGAVRMKPAAIPPRQDSEDRYAVYFTQELIEMGMPHDEIEKKLEDIALQTMAGLKDEEEDWLGDTDKWAEIEEEHPNTTRVLVCDNEIVGYYFFLFLEEEFIEGIRNGTFSDSEISLEKIVHTEWGGEYPLYFNDIAILPNHRMRGAKKLLGDVPELLIQFARDNELFVTELVTIAFTKYGEDLCSKRMNMKLTGKSKKRGDNVYSLTLLPFPEKGYLAEHYPELKQLYDEQYRSRSED